jgi:hypothetical protein
VQQAPKKSNYSTKQKLPKQIYMAAVIWTRDRKDSGQRFFNDTRKYLPEFCSICCHVIATPTSTVFPPNLQQNYLIFLWHIFPHPFVRSPGNVGASVSLVANQNAALRRTGNRHCKIFTTLANVSKALRLRCKFIESVGLYCCISIAFLKRFLSSFVWWVLLELSGSPQWNHNSVLS